MGKRDGSLDRTHSSPSFFPALYSEAHASWGFSVALVAVALAMSLGEAIMASQLGGYVRRMRLAVLMLGGVITINGMPWIQRERSGK